MLQTKNFYKIIDEHTLLIAPDNRQKRPELETRSSARSTCRAPETKQVVSVIRTLLNSRQVAENDAAELGVDQGHPRQGRDRREADRIERQIEGRGDHRRPALGDQPQDAPNPGHRPVREVPDRELSGRQAVRALERSVGAEAAGELARRPDSQRGHQLPQDRFRHQVDRAAADPRERGREGEIVIANRVPIPNTSFNSSQTVGGNIVPITSFTYQNVGITLQIEPRVHHNKEVTLKVQVEVSNLAGVVDLGTGVSQPIIATRQIQTVIRLRDGETNLLAGLIKRDDTKSKSGVGRHHGHPRDRRRLLDDDHRSSGNRHRVDPDALHRAHPRHPGGRSPDAVGRHGGQHAPSAARCAA
jgi:general secretion pathway protein D